MRVIIVGGGIVGLSAAWALRRAGHEPVLLEKGPAVPNPLAASHDRHRVIRLAHAEGDGRGVIIHEAYAAWARLWADLGRSQYRETGMLLTARAPDDWAVTCRKGFDRNGTAYETWNRAKLAERFPYLLVGANDWGLYTPEGGVLFADRILDDLGRWLAAHEVPLRARAVVTEIDPDRALVTLDSGERLQGEAIVLAAGAWTGKLLPELAPSLEPRRAVVFYLEPPPDLALAWAGAPSFLDFGGKDDLYLIPPIEGMPLKFGAGSTSFPADPDDPRDLRSEDPERLLSCLRPFVKDLDRYRIVDHRVCMYCFSRDERFIAGTLANGRLAFATGCSGQMFKFGAVMGEKLAEAVVGRLDGAALARWAVGNVAPAAAA